MTALHRFPFFGRLALLAGAGLLAVLVVGPALSRSMVTEARAIPPPAEDPPVAASTATAVFAGGCFWGVQAVFQHVKGVTSAISGYAGGEAATARYALVGSGSTGHAEAVEVRYDPRQVSYGQLLQVFFSVAHDPTQLNRQGPDVGTQYRSALFPLDETQARLARAYIGQLNRARVFPAAIVTKIEPGQTFYRAEAYHQDFLALNPKHPYIVMHDLPKLAALQQLLPALYRAQPALVGPR